MTDAVHDWFANDYAESGGTMTPLVPSQTSVKTPWFPFTITVGDVQITLHAYGKWEGSTEALREVLAKSDAWTDSTSRILLWLILRQMEQDRRFW